MVANVTWKERCGTAVPASPCCAITVAMSSLKLPSTTPGLSSWRCWTWQAPTQHNVNTGYKFPVENQKKTNMCNQAHKPMRDVINVLKVQSSTDRGY